MTERPSRTVTFLFSDIEGSTRLLQELEVEPRLLGGSTMPWYGGVRGGV